MQVFARGCDDFSSVGPSRGPSRCPVGTFWRCLKLCRRNLGRLGVSLGRSGPLGAFLGASGGVSERSLAILEAHKGLL
eukprot:3852616-Pyramimonas_sp.AAC.1